MNQEPYLNYKIKGNFSVFEFVSIGPKGKIRKRVQFTPTEVDPFFSLGLGNIDERGKIDYDSISNNGDMEKIFATVIDIINSYTEKYRNRIIMFQGNTGAKNRLYRMIIGLNFEALSEKYHIWILCKDEYMPFKKNIDASRFFIWRNK